MKVSNSHSVLQGQYEALDIDLFHKVDLTPRDWSVLQKGKNNPKNRAFLNSLPIIVAQFKEGAYSEVTQWAIKQNRLYSSLTKPLRMSFVSGYEKGTMQIDDCLFGFGSSILDCEIGKFSRSRTPYIHADGISLYQARRMYVARVGSLPIYFIRGTTLSALQGSQKEEIRSLISAAEERNFSSASRVAKQKLIELKILEELPLGAVALMSWGDYMGTLHCSSDLPLRKDGKEAPQYSAFFRNQVNPKI